MDRGIKNMKHADRGFSLIEILVVITIIGLLITVSTGAYQKFTERAEKAKTGTLILEIEEYGSDYNDRRGDFPPSTLKVLGLATTGDEANEGIEAFVQALFNKDYDGHRPDSISELINNDGDEANKNKTSFPRAELLEFPDAWGNPLIYIRHTDYEKSFTYLLEGPTGLEHVEVSALKNPKTGTFYNFESCQIMSAGPDLEFNTEDDVANFKRYVEDDE